MSNQEVNYIVSKTDLTSVANAIRSKRNHTNQITFPDGFVNEINRIKLGMTDEEASKLVSILNGTITRFSFSQNFKDYVNDMPHGSDFYLRPYAFAGCNELYSVELCLNSYRELYKISDNAFYNCQKLQRFFCAASTIMGPGAFNGCPSLSSITVYRDLFNHSFGLEAATFSNFQRLRSVTWETPMMKDRMFANDSELRSITFYCGMYDYMHGTDAFGISDIFEGCNSLSDIYLLPSERVYGEEYIPWEFSLPSQIRNTVTVYVHSSLWDYYYYNSYLYNSLGDPDTQMQMIE